MANNRERDKNTIRRLKTREEIKRMLPRLPDDFKRQSMGTFLEMSQITPEVYLSGILGLTQEDFKKYKINCVINATDDIPDMDIKGITYLRVELDDTPNQDISQHLEPTADYIHRIARRGGHTVVHCMSGVSRSTALVLGYLIKYKNMSLKDAFNLVHQKRDCIKVNPGFIRQLMAYERRIRGQNSFRLVSYTSDGVRVVVPDFWLIEHMDMVNLDIKEEKKRLRSRASNVDSNV